MRKGGDDQLTIPKAQILAIARRIFRVLQAIVRGW